MTEVTHRRNKRSREFDFLRVDDFLGDIFETRALATAFETGLIDALIQKKSLPRQSLLEKARSGNGMGLLLGLLESNGVITVSGDNVTLTEEFTRALKFRDLMELKSQWADWTAHDFLDYFNDLVYNPDLFFQKAKSFRLFAYDRCLILNRDNYEATKRWMRITTTLTKYESQACLKYYDFGSHKRILDIGGNSGEFVLRICKEHPAIRAMVFDLPVVCAVGEERIRREPEADRITFVKGSALKDELPGGFDLVMFKSMLHDWPEKEVVHFIRNAGRSLHPDGRLLIFERGPIEMGETGQSYYKMPILLFSNSFRSPSFYQTLLKDFDFEDIKVTNVFLDTRFFILTARKKM